MKKILSLVLALAMVLSCASAMAAIHVDSSVVDHSHDPNWSTNGLAGDIANKYNFDKVTGTPSNLGGWGFWSNTMGQWIGSGNLNGQNLYTTTDQSAIDLSISVVPQMDKFGSYHPYDLRLEVYDRYTGEVIPGFTQQLATYQNVAATYNTALLLDNILNADGSIAVKGVDGLADGASVVIGFVIDYANPDVPDEKTKLYVNKIDTDAGAAWTLRSRTWYPDNHAHAFQALSQKSEGSNWKTYAALKLAEGTQEIDLVASGAYNIGNIIVTVKGDEVVFDYLMHEDRKTTDIWDEITVDSEYINIVPADQIPSEWAESAFEFGVPYSIANDLGGATEVNLFVELVVDYSPNNPYVFREWTGMRP